MAITLKAASALGFAAAALLVLFGAEPATAARGAGAGGQRPAGVAWAGCLTAAGLLSVAWVFTAVGGTLVEEHYRDSTLEVFSATANNLAFAGWVPLGLSMGAVAIGALRHASVPRWLGVLSTVALAALLGAVLLGLPFASWALVTAWLVAAGVATVRDKGI